MSNFIQFQFGSFCNEICDLLNDAFDDKNNNSTNEQIKTISVTKNKGLIKSEVYSEEDLINNNNNQINNNNLLINNTQNDKNNTTFLLNQNILDSFDFYGKGRILNSSYYNNFVFFINYLIIRLIKYSTKQDFY